MGKDAQSEIAKRIESICNEFDSRVIDVGLSFARLELAKVLAETEASQQADVADQNICPLCGGKLTGPYMRCLVCEKMKIGSKSP